MKTIMFNEVEADFMRSILAGQKTMTRRPVPQKYIDEWKKYRKKHPDTKLTMPEWIVKHGLAKFVEGEVVAIAQSYKALRLSPNMTIMPKRGTEPVRLIDSSGWENKMFVSATLMKHHIRITSIRIERLTDIPDEDVEREGIFALGYNEDIRLTEYAVSRKKKEVLGYSPRQAFQKLINRLSGETTWKKNPWVYVYGFELVD